MYFLHELVHPTDTLLSPAKENQPRLSIPLIASQSTAQRLYMSETNVKGWPNRTSGATQLYIILNWLSS